MGQYFRPCVLRKNYKLATKSNMVLASLSSYAFNNGSKLMEHSYIGNSYVKNASALIGDDSEFFGYPFAWVGDYADKINGKSLYDFAREIEDETYKELKHILTTPTYKYIVNFTKKEYVEIAEYDENIWQVHPLPLLTAVGNGRGGGDYGLYSKRVGRWAFDRIGCTNNPTWIEGMKRIDGVFELDW